MSVHDSSTAEQLSLVQFPPHTASCRVVGPRVGVEVGSAVVGVDVGPTVVGACVVSVGVGSAAVGVGVVGARVDPAAAGALVVGSTAGAAVAGTAVLGDAVVDPAVTHTKAFRSNSQPTESSHAN